MQYVAPLDSNGEHTWGWPVEHSPGTAQQSESVVHVCVQYPSAGGCMHVAVPISAPASIEG
jgi:hypothetical protein